jgi:hypothetical protein
VHPARAGRIGADGVDHDGERGPGPGLDQPDGLAVGEHDLHSGRHPVAQAGHHGEPGPVVTAVLVTTPITTIARPSLRTARRSGPLAPAEVI